MAHEAIGNLHCHTPYSDGCGSHADIALAALQAGLDFVVVTDHNVYVDGQDGYRTLGQQRVLLLVGEEVHDSARQPQKNHLLAYEANRELAPFAAKPQRLLDAVSDSGGLSFFAHPDDPALPWFDEPDYAWVDWDLEGFTGIELWNYMSEFKSLLKTRARAVFYAYLPAMIARGPFPETLARWDALLAAGKRVVAIGGSDAHAWPWKAGLLKRVIFPYEFLFRTVNTHVILSEPLAGDLETDRRRIFHGLRRGHCFVGYDLPYPTRGFRFSAHGDEDQAIMGDSIRARFGVTLQVRLPLRAEIRLLRDGHEVKSWPGADLALTTVATPGAYRVEVYIMYKGRRRAWIFSNPIYVLA